MNMNINRLIIIPLSSLLREGYLRNTPNLRTTTFRRVLTITMIKADPIEMAVLIE